ncbi:uncharacterized protein LOC135211441 [Macrobrachium nipponense]|uniref:uncharacterized protein LOC135211441 n=1 Tax=Macrobrachium nipponense TaxID=159736 RepID=UPI0030C843C7
MPEDQKKEKAKKQRRRRRCWMWPYLQRREENGYCDNLMRELAIETPGMYRNFMGITVNFFNEIVERVTLYIGKTLTFWRRPILPGLRVAIISFLTTGDSYKSLSFQFRVAHNTISSIVPGTCRAIVAAFGDEVIQLPTTPEEWKTVARGFQERWNFPHTLGTVDWKRTRIKNTLQLGLAVVDAEYKFMYVDVGAIGSKSDAGVYAKTQLCRMFDGNESNLPAFKRLPNESEDKPRVAYFFIGYDAFALEKYMMKP